MHIRAQQSIAFKIIEAVLVPLLYVLAASDLRSQTKLLIHMTFDKLHGTLDYLLGHSSVQNHLSNQQVRKHLIKAWHSASFCDLGDKYEKSKTLLFFCAYLSVSYLTHQKHTF